MVYRIIWADGVAPRVVEAAIGCRELSIVTMKKTHKESINSRKARKANPIERIQYYQGNIDKQQSQKQCYS